MTYKQKYDRCNYISLAFMIMAILNRVMVWGYWPMTTEMNIGATTGTAICLIEYVYWSIKKSEAETMIVFDDFLK